MPRAQTARKGKRKSKLLPQRADSSAIHDVRTVDRLGDLGPTLPKVLRELQAILGSGAALSSTSEGIDTRKHSSKNVHRLVDALVSIERSSRSKAISDGMAHASRRGIRPGPKKKLSDAQARKARRLVDEGQKPEDVARRFGVSRASLYRYFKQVRNMLAQ
jgi:DNA invertase Pin-like site-specific DNA recombinase